MDVEVEGWIVEGGGDVEDRLVGGDFVDVEGAGRGGGVEERGTVLGGSGGGDLDVEAFDVE